jgi:hypothetical protein
MVGDLLADALKLAFYARVSTGNIEDFRVSKSKMYLRAFGILR